MEKFKQDMPPAGGYAPITYQRVPLKSGMGLPLKVLTGCLFTGVGCYFVHVTKRKFNLERIEMACARTAMAPMLLAETDRMYLKQVRRNRDEEERIMKDVKGWEVGKYKGDPVYLSLPPDEFFVVSPSEFYAHADESLKYYSFNIAKLQY